MSQHLCSIMLSEVGTKAPLGKRPNLCYRGLISKAVSMPVHPVWEFTLI